MKIIISVLEQNLTTAFLYSVSVCVGDEGSAGEVGS